MKQVNFDSLPIAVQTINAKIDAVLTILKASDLKDQIKADSFLNVDEAARFLGLSKNTIYSKVSKNELPVMKQGKRLYFSEEELSSYIKSGKVLSNDEIMMQADKFISKNIKK